VMCEVKLMGKKYTMTLIEMLGLKEAGEMVARAKWYGQFGYVLRKIMR